MKPLQTQGKLLLLLILLLGVNTLQGQTIKQIDKAGLAALLNKTADTVYVLNFWATWCRPCVEELPSFDTLARAFEKRPVKIVLVSNDFLDEINTKLKPFIRKRKPKPEVQLITETDASAWLELVDKDWSGAIPVTLLYHGKTGKRHFIMAETRFAELERLTNDLLAK